MEECIVDGEIIGMRFGLASPEEICTASVSDFPISHASQLTNPFLGLPLESGKCESCGTAEPGKCEGHFGYIELPIPIYHPCHVNELKRILSLLCLKCLRLKKRKENAEYERLSNACQDCRDVPPISIKEVKTTDGAYSLELQVPSKSKPWNGSWKFLERYGFCYGENLCRTLLPYEALQILKRIPAETKKKLAGKGYFPDCGFVLQYLPVPPNCLAVPDISDGITMMSSDLSISMLKKVLKQVESIKNSRSGSPNFESHEVEANDLQSAVAQYLHVRGSTKAFRDINLRYGVNKETSDSSKKTWLEKMKTLFISKGSGFSSRCAITGDAYKGVNEVGLPFEIAQRITFEEKVNMHNMESLQELVDNKFCLTYKVGLSTYSLKEGSKGHTFLRPGQVVHRRIMDGDIIFLNRPPSTHKHSIQALSVYIHNDNVVKINPLICGPLGADFDGDCIHLFYPQSLAAKAEALELFSVEKQLLSSHSGDLNLQFANDSLLSLKTMFRVYFLNRAAAQQLAMFVSTSLPQPALWNAQYGPRWTTLQILGIALPAQFDCCGERHLICQSEMLKVDFNRGAVQPLFNDIISSIFFKEGSKEALKFFNCLQPLLMENMFSEGFTVSLEDFFIVSSVLQNLRMHVQNISPLFHHLRSAYSELVELQVENHLRLVKMPVVNFILKASSLGDLIDSKSDSSINKVVQQVGFLGLQLSDRGKLYSRTLVEEMTWVFQSKYSICGVDLPSEAFGLIKSCFFQGLNPYEELVHSISTREVIVRSSRGLTGPGTLFKNLMAILRDAVICYDGTVRNVCSNSVVQFNYGGGAGSDPQGVYPAGEPVGILAATAISNPAYKAVLDSSSSSNSSWELMKEILLCRLNFKNEPVDRRVILFLNDCFCGKKYCKENAAYLVQSHLKKVHLKDIAVDFMIEYQKQRNLSESLEHGSGLVAHVHLDKMQLKMLKLGMHEVLLQCQDTINSFRKKKNQLDYFLKSIILSISECCCLQGSSDGKWSEFPCLQFYWQDASDSTLERILQIMANKICPVILQTIVRGDPRVSTANIIWISPDTTTWIRNSCKNWKGELALEIVLEKAAMKKNGDAWRTVLDCCIPVMHLIDTRRSVPYAIKQIEELLGISCVFDQAVQRLSTSVRMVMKGVLKEHLILIANSMTCTGNLIGFNVGGYKAMFRSLNVQVPFTEAMLSTPRKCFERAAEKVHMDTLSSIFASCSWGKHVAVGTGTQFEILWNKKEMEMNSDDGMDIYNFIHLVRSSLNEGESNTACLGTEIDDLELENGDMEFDLSPKNHSGFDNPIFDDVIEVQYGLEENDAPKTGNSSESNWGRSSSSNVKSGSWGEWNSGQCQNLDMDIDTSKPNIWSSWGTDNDQTQQIHSNMLKASSKSDGWDSRELQSGDNHLEHLNSCEKEAAEAEKIGWDNSGGKGKWGKPKDLNNNACEKEAAEADKIGWGNSGGKDQWGKQKDLNNWDTPVDSPKDEPQVQMAHQRQSPYRTETCGTEEGEEQVNQPTSSLGWHSQGWGPSIGGDWNESKMQTQWDQNKYSSSDRKQSPHGWPSSGDWKSKKKWPANSQAKLSNDRNATGNFPATRQRLDIFTDEEKDVLLVVESITQFIRRVMHQSRYNDGDPLSADDQSYVLDNVFNYHPQKEAKMGDGVEYVMISKHSSFQDSRCFYVVSKSGHKEDFSYRKCLENMINIKYPGIAESFIGKYFKRPRSGRGHEQEQGTPASPALTPSDA